MFGPWSAWGACSVTCGTGWSLRSRGLYDMELTTPSESLSQYTPCQKEACRASMLIKLHYFSYVSFVKYCFCHEKLYFIKFHTNTTEFFHKK